MHVLYFHQHYTNPNGAGGTRSYEFARKLIAAGHQVTMVCGSYAGGATGLSHSFNKGMRKGTVEGINIIEFDLPYSNKSSFLQRIKTFLKYSFSSIQIIFTCQYDLVFATSTPLTASIPGIIARWFKKKPFVFEVRDLWPELPRAMGAIKNPLILKLMAILEWVSYHSANYCIALAPGILQGIHKKNIPLERIKLIPNGCDLELFSQNTQSSSTDFVAIFAGTHGDANGLDALIQVAVELKKMHASHIKLVLVGDGKKKIDLIKQAQDLKLDNCIFKPAISKYGLLSLYSEASIGLMILKNVPAFYDGTSPNKFFDYIACGLPVICNYPGWIAELIKDNKCGYEVSPGNAVQFAQLLFELSTQPELTKEMSQNALKLAHAKFDRALLSEQFVAVLQEAI